MREVHPGEVLKDELDELGITPTEFARQIDVPPNRISQIIAGKRAVTGDTALRLGHWFGTEPQFWLNLQSAYEIRIAEEKAGREIARLPVRAGAARPDASSMASRQTSTGSGRSCARAAPTISADGYASAPKRDALGGTA